MGLATAVTGIAAATIAIAAALTDGRSSMGIFDALNTAVTGLTAQSFALQNISGNIANSQTTAYKGTATNFETLLSDQNAAPAQQTAGSVIASSSSTVTVQGDIQST